MAVATLPTALTHTTTDEPDAPWSHASTFAEFHAAHERWQHVTGGRPGFNPRGGVNSVAVDLLPLMVAEGLYNTFAPRMTTKVYVVGYEVAKVTESDMIAALLRHGERLTRLVMRPRWAGFDGRLGLFMHLVEAGALYTSLYVYTYRLKPAARAQAEQAAAEYCNTVVPKALTDLVPNLSVREPVGAAVAALRRLAQRGDFNDPTFAGSKLDSGNRGLILPLRDELRKLDPSLVIP